MCNDDRATSNSQVWIAVRLWSAMPGSQPEATSTAPQCVSAPRVRQKHHSNIELNSLKNLFSQQNIVGKTNCETTALTLTCSEILVFPTIVHNALYRLYCISSQPKEKGASVGRIIRNSCVLDSSHWARGNTIRPWKAIRAMTVRLLFFPWHLLVHRIALASTARLPRVAAPPTGIPHLIEQRLHVIKSGMKCLCEAATG